MSTVHLIQTIAEAIAVGVVIYGAFNEDKFVAFEEKIAERFFRKRKAAWHKPSGIGNDD